MGSKTFAPPEVRQPRGVNTDPAFRAAASAFAEPPPPPQAQPDAGPAAGATPVTADAVVPSPNGKTAAEEADARGPSTPAQPTAPPPTLAFAPAVLPESKMTIYPGITERARLATIKAHHRLAESIVAEYALEELFRQRTDDEIATVLRGRGHSLRRARPTAPR
jgi:hypothetical protein